MTEETITVHLNGRKVRLDCSGLESLASVLRDQEYMTSVKIGCSEGYCGSCTVLLDGQPAVSCLTPAVACDGSEIRTSEDDFDESSLVARLRSELCAIDAVQCGMCTPGMVLTVAALIESGNLTSPEQVPEVMVGSICRCSGYTRIIEAIQRVMETEGSS